MILLNLLTGLLLAAAVFFFVAGTIGLLRFPDLYCRLHALTKADNLALDWILVLAIVLLAWRSLNDPDLFRSVMEFMVLGLLIAVAWIRLRAPDVALAEAAVGSGLTGALLLSALARLRRRERSTKEERKERA